MPPRINKFLVSAVATVGVIANALSDGHVSDVELGSIVVSLVGSILVYVVPNYHGPSNP